MANIFISIAAVLTILFIGYYFIRFDKNRHTDDAQVQQLLTPVNARVSGYIKSVHFKDFDWVNKGDTLVIIDNTDYLVQKELAEAALMDARAGKKITVSNISTVENGINISEARVYEVKAKLWNAQKNYQRYKSLLKKESVTQQQFDQVKSDYEVLEAQLETLERSTTGNHLNAQEASSKIDVNLAAIKRAEVQFKMAELNLNYTIITAPCNGYVGRKTITAGQLVQAGQQLSNVIDNDNKWITANFKEKQLATIKIGDLVNIKIDGLPDVILLGHVQAFASATGSVYSMVPVDNATGNFVKIQQRIPTRIEFDKSTDPAILAQLKAGMNVVVEIQKGDR
ncbi:HlyD family secretion protein [Sphingobacterium sp. ML3W]|uniref:HlyD family secretion protein n=1 Tax=Sphingobacterium sp. ML3W TaxID=1538644 RepID=UPI000A70563C|nr:HlyD family secretion protein [Sphingobacterium sp. ML3W]